MLSSKVMSDSFSVNVILLFVTFPLSILLLVQAPFIFLLAIMAGALLLYNNFSIYIFAIASSLFVGTFASIIDVNATYYADVIRYYSLYNSKDFLSSLLSFRIYRYFIFLFMDWMDLREGFYSLITLSLAGAIYQLTLIKQIKYLAGVDIVTLKQKMIYTLIVLCALPAFTLLGYEFIFSVVIANAVAYSLMRNNLLLALMLSAFALIIHSASIYLLSIAFLVFVLKRKKSALIMVSICFTFLLTLLSSFRLSIGIQYIDRLMAKLYSYSTGYWSQFTTVHDKILIVYIVIKLLLALVLLYLYQDRKNTDRFSYIYSLLLTFIIVSISFVTMRTLALRLILIPFLFFMPLMYLLVLHEKVSQSLKFIIFLFIIFNGVMYHNILTLRFIKNEMNIGDGYFLFMSAKEIKSFSIYMPDNSILFDTRAN